MSSGVITSLSLKRGLAPAWPCCQPAAWAWYQSSTQTYTTVPKSSNAMQRAIWNSRNALC